MGQKVVSLPMTLASGRKQWLTKLHLPENRCLYCRERSPRVELPRRPSLHFSLRMRSLACCQLCSRRELPTLSPHSIDGVPATFRMKWPANLRSGFFAVPRQLHHLRRQPAHCAFHLPSRKVTGLSPTNSVGIPAADLSLNFPTFLLLFRPTSIQLILYL